MIDAHLIACRAQLDEYQEQSYLLDPHLEKIVTPVVNALQEVVRERRGTLVNSTAAIQNLYRLLYHYTKVRGHKTISEHKKVKPIQ